MTESIASYTTTALSYSLNCVPLSLGVVIIEFSRKFPAGISSLLCSLLCGVVSLCAALNLCLLLSVVCVCVSAHATEHRDTAQKHSRHRVSRSSYV